MSTHGQYYVRCSVGVAPHGYGLHLAVASAQPPAINEPVMTLGSSTGATIPRLQGTAETVQVGGCLTASGAVGVPPSDLNGVDLNTQLTICAARPDALMKADASGVRTRSQVDTEVATVPRPYLGIAIRTMLAISVLSTPRAPLAHAVSEVGTCTVDHPKQPHNVGRRSWSLFHPYPTRGQ